MALTTRIALLVMLAAIVFAETATLGTAGRPSASARDATAATSAESDYAQYTLNTSAGVSGYVEAF